MACQWRAIVIIYNRAKAQGEKIMKQIKITLRNKTTGEVITLSCHHYMGDANAYYLNGVKGLTKYGQEMTFNKTEWEKI